MSPEIIFKYFPNLTERQSGQIRQLGELYADWNAKINVVSRKDIDMLYEHHVLHSLAIAKFIRFKPSTQVLDFGTGGGFPGIPLAILYPDVRWTLIDGTGKKILVATEVARSLGLSNVTAKQIRGEEEKGLYDFVVSRAVMPLPDLAKIVTKNIRKKGTHVIPNGIICLKGGDLTHEIHPFRRIIQTVSLSDWYEEEWYAEKHLIHLPF